MPYVWEFYRVIWKQKCPLGCFNLSKENDYPLNHIRVALQYSFVRACTAYENNLDKTFKVDWKENDVDYQTKCLLQSNILFSTKLRKLAWKCSMNRGDEGWKDSIKLLFMPCVWAFIYAASHFNAYGYDARGSM